MHDRDSHIKHEQERVPKLCGLVSDNHMYSQLSKTDRHHLDYVSSLCAQITHSHLFGIILSKLFFLVSVIIIFVRHTSVLNSNCFRTINIKAHLPPAIAWTLTRSRSQT